MDEVLASGQLVSGTGGEGIVRRVGGPQDVIAMMGRDDLEDTIVVVESAAATAIVPLMAVVSGVVCRTGGMTSHVAIVAREFGQLCVVGVELDATRAPDGQRISVDAEGTIRAVG